MNHLFYLRRITLYCCLIFVSPLLHSQTNSKFTYLIIYVDGVWDYTRGRNFLKINADGGNPQASEVYNLKEYVSAKKVVNTGASFYCEKNDTASIYFNYFLTTTEIMQFLADHNWELIIVNTEIGSTYDNIQEGDRFIPITKIVSRPVYYFKKQIAQ